MTIMKYAYVIAITSAVILALVLVNKPKMFELTIKLVN